MCGSVSATPSTVDAKHTETPGYYSGDIIDGSVQSNNGFDA
jgi:hypothetical protein